MFSKREICIQQPTAKSLPLRSQMLLAAIISWQLDLSTMVLVS
jgi:hypothetical protein